MLPKVTELSLKLVLSVYSVYTILAIMLKSYYCSPREMKSLHL